jgi:hypothetical protein
MTDPTQNDADAGDNAWARTLADAEARADELEAEGWTATTVRAGHVAPVGPDSDAADLTGLVFVVPSEEGEAFADLVDGGVTDYAVFTERDGATRFLVVEVRDATSERAVLLVGAVPLDQADDLAEHAHERGEIRTHVRALDETPYGTVEYDDPSLFFPR